MLDLLLAIISGIGLGIITGLLPGVHINLVMTLIVPLVATGSHGEALVLVAGIVSLAATHTILDFIPSIYLGAPEEETALSILPAHQLLMQGRGHEALLIIITGALCGLGALIISVPLFIYGSPYLEPVITPIIPFVLLGVVIFMILREENPVPAIVSFIAAGFLGYATLNLPIEQPLFPLLGGLFGMSGLVLALKKTTKIPKQEEIQWDQIEITKKDCKRTLKDVLIAGFPCSVLPALGSGYASLIASEITKKTSRQFLLISSAMNLYAMGASLIIVYSLSKARTGAAAGIQEVLRNITGLDLIIMLAIFALVTLCACTIAIKLSKKCAYVINKIAYNKISIITMVVITGIVLIISGPIGALVLATGAAIGMYGQLSGIKRMHLMGCLILPTILYYLG